MTAPKLPIISRKRLLIGGSLALLALLLVALGIPQLIYWKTQAGIANSHADIEKSVAYTQSAGGGQGPLSRDEQDHRVQALTKAAAAGLIAQCNPNLAPLPVGAPDVVPPSTPVSQIQCASLPEMSTRPAPNP